MENLFKVVGVVVSIGDLILMQNKVKKTTVYKKVLHLSFKDGRQSFYMDVVNSKLKDLELQNIDKGDTVSVEFSFRGSEKNGKKYNNIYCNSITKISFS